MTVDDIYKTKSKLYRCKNWPLLILTTGSWFPAITYDLHGMEGPEISNGSDLSGLMDTEEYKDVEPASEKDYRFFIENIFDENIDMQLLL